MEKSQELFDKITKGLELTFERLLAAKRKEDGEFVFYENGKIIKIKARDYIPKRKNQ